MAAEPSAFEAARREVLAKNPEYSQFYAIVGEYADWEHRYDEIVELMREAVNLDPDDPVALASLGVNLMRAGREKDSVTALSRAFSLDHFWMPFTPNREFKREPRLFARAEGLHYFTPDTVRRLIARAGLAMLAVRPATKPLTLDYAAANLARFEPRLGRLAGAAIGWLPAADRSRLVPLPIGEMLVLARETSPDPVVTGRP